MIDKLTIVISGQITRENSANLKNFWRGFINIQRAIEPVKELKIVGHSWNPEFDELVRNVYNPNILESEYQKSFVREYMPLLKPVDKFERGFKRAGSTWRKVTPNNLLGQVTSKTKSIYLLDRLGLHSDDLVISTRWDIGCTGGKEVNTIIFDSALDKEYLYLAYYPQIDEGYADMWFIGAYKNMQIFQHYKQYLLDSIAGKNSYFDDFTKNGWMLSLPKSKNFRSLSYINVLIGKFNHRLVFLLLKKSISFLFLITEKFKSKFKIFSKKVISTGENSLPMESKSKNCYLIPESLNIHAILKSFIFSFKMRKKTRFLDINDFEKLSDDFIINPLPFCCVIYSHSSYSDCWEMAIRQMQENLSENCKKIFLLSEDSLTTTEKFSHIDHESVELLTYDENSKYTDRLITTLSIISKNFELVYFVHEDMPLFGKVDSIYLNSLLHYLNNSNEFYIKLVDTNYIDEKEEHESFPDLVKNTGGYSISVQPSIFKIKYFISFLTNFHQDIYGFEEMCINSNLTFSAVKGYKKIGKYLLVNKYFPHIATAIRKARWCTSEWENEINQLAEKYNINLFLRGKC